LNFPDFSEEQKYWDNETFIVGVDEAGRGCLAGPVVAAAVVFPINFAVDNSICVINDSKKLNLKQRLKCFQYITQNAIDFSVAIVDSSIIDEINILNASILAMNLAISKLHKIKFHLLIDGNRFYTKLPFSYTTIVQGDSKSISISAASIIAKVTRDNFVRDYLHQIYPNYKFDKHLGYATKHHFEAIDKFGTTPDHRKSFLVKYYARKNYQINKPLF
jgi:ribonuclease HII